MRPLNKIQNSVLQGFVKVNEYILTITMPSGRKKRIRVKASKYKQAVNIACSRYRGKWINFSLAKKMDLISARVDAAKLSTSNKERTAYVILKEDEFFVTASPAPKDDVYAKYKSGSEDKEYLDSLKPEKTPKKQDKLGKVARATVEKINVAESSTSKSNKMKTEKSAPAKSSKKEEKPSKSAPAKEVKTSKGKDSKPSKAAKGKPEKGGKAEKKTRKPKYTEGKRVTMTNKEMTAKIKKGYSYFNEAGVNKTKYIPERPNQDLKNVDYYEVAPE